VRRAASATAGDRVCDEWTSQSAEKSKAQLDAEFSDLYRAHLRDVLQLLAIRVGDHHDARI